MKFVQPIRDPEIIADIKKKLLKLPDLRNYIYFELGINTGLRVSDILQLRVGDLKKSHLYLTEIKTHKQKEFEMNHSVRRELLKLVEGRDNDEFLIKSREGVNKSITRNMAYKIINSITEPYGLVGMGTHSLRKTYGYHFYKVEHDIGSLQKIFNHSDPSFTLRYIGITQDTINASTRKFRI
jgi:integrase